ncbi:penicillin-binding protein 2 [Dysgonomonas sp. 520]|uniref:penicillin-binding protein 2 n=1 Tax=Dysgonomonas sp. 520 TaxID=2302931 RepID=UPI0013D0C4AB|nr:penicillin-binding protein 2 [Dysgonomonas sp. 520]
MASTNKFNFEKRKYVIGGAATIIVLILVTQLFALQILSSDYKDSADGNAFYNKTLYPARGTIFDRKDRLLVYNRPTYDIVYIPREVQPFDTLDFCNILGITREELDKRFADVKNKTLNPGYSTYTMQTLMTQLELHEYGLFQEKSYKFPGFYIQNRALRQYNYLNGAQVLGYVAEVNKNMIKNDDYYVRGDYAGRSGVESSYENLLRGEKGVEILLRDAHGRIQGHYENGKHDVAPVSGRNLKLSIDIDLQAYGEYLMQGKRGSIVMIEPATGEIVCMVTAPTYDPSILLGRDFGKNYLTLANDPDKPLLNRAIQGVYPPGSTFKTTQGLIFLQEGIIQPSTMYSCARGYPPGGGRPKCHGHGSPLPLEPAIATSCNSYFCYGLNAMLSNRKKYKNILEAFDRWKDDLVKMGFGYKLDVDLPSEMRGFIPNSAYYSKNFKTENWYPQNVISIAIGQGEVLATPLQVANLAATIANRGYYYKPHVVKEVQDTVLDAKYTTPNYTGVEEKHYVNIVEGMAKAVTGGTCRGTNLLPEIEVCGKTGTAQNSHGKDHSIFMGFAPKNEPKVAIFVVVENGEWGATFGVPIGRLMFQKYLKGEIRPGDKPIEDRIAHAIVHAKSATAWGAGKAKANNETKPATPTENRNSTN